MLQAIVFDFDGVIADSEPLHYQALNQIALKLGAGFSYEDYVEKYIGYDDRDAFRAILKDTGQGSDVTDARIARLIEEKGGAFEAIVEQGIASFPGTIDFIRHAAGRLPVAIASGATSRDITIILQHMKLAELFEVIVSASDVHRSKPDPMTYRLAVEKLAEKHVDRNIRPDQCLAIEDTPTGIASARGAGLWTLGITTTGSKESMSVAHRVIPNLQGLTVDDLHKWFG